MSDPKDDPILADDGYPSEAELIRIREWDPDTMGWHALMAYIRQRWEYADAGYWTERAGIEYKHAYYEYAPSTAGWSGNESLIGALQDNLIFQMVCAESWERGGHYRYRIPDSLEPKP